MESGLRLAAAEDAKDFSLLAKEISELNAKADYAASRYDSSVSLLPLLIQMQVQNSSFRFLNERSAWSTRIAFSIHFQLRR